MGRHLPVYCPGAADAVAAADNFRTASWQESINMTLPRGMWRSRPVGRRPPIRRWFIENAIVHRRLVSVIRAVLAARSIGDRPVAAVVAAVATVSSGVDHLRSGVCTPQSHFISAGTLARVPTWLDRAYQLGADAILRTPSGANAAVPRRVFRSPAAEFPTYRALGASSRVRT